MVRDIHRKCRFSAWLVKGLLLGGCAGAPAVATALDPAPRTPRMPEAAPARFTTENYGLTLAIPPGLFRCGYPATWAGDDGGIILYLIRPRTCDPDGPSAAGPEAARLPEIRVWYEHNVLDATTLEGCGMGSSVPVAWRHLGGMWRGCATTLTDGRVAMQSSAFHDQYAPMAGPHSADSIVTIRLQTKRARYARDAATFRAIAASVAACATKPPQPLARPPCGPRTAW